MRYLSRTTLGELTGLNYPMHIRTKARELLRLLEEGKTPEPTDHIEMVRDDFSSIPCPQRPLN